MIPLAWDEDISDDIATALRRVQPDIDIRTTREAGLFGAPDTVQLQRAAEERRVLVTCDRRMRGAIEERMKAGEPMMGVIVVPKDMPIGLLIQELEIIALCSEPDEWVNRIFWIRRKP